VGQRRGVPQRSRNRRRRHCRRGGRCGSLTIEGDRHELDAQPRVQQRRRQRPSLDESRAAKCTAAGSSQRRSRALACFASRKRGERLRIGNSSDRAWGRRDQTADGTDGRSATTSLMVGEDGEHPATVLMQTLVRGACCARPSHTPVRRGTAHAPRCGWDRAIADDAYGRPLMVDMGPPGRGRGRIEPRHSAQIGLRRSGA
jgi:hypothetical protein